RTFSLRFGDCLIGFVFAESSPQVTVQLGLVPIGFVYLFPNNERNVIVRIHGYNCSTVGNLPAIAYQRRASVQTRISKEKSNSTEAGRKAGTTSRCAQSA